MIDADARRDYGRFPVGRIFCSKTRRTTGSRAELRHRLNTEIALHDPDILISPSFKFDAVGTVQPTFSPQRSQRRASFWTSASSPTSQRVTVRVEPAWNVLLGDARLATALLRLQGVIVAYEIVMFVVVLVSCSERVTSAGLRACCSKNARHWSSAHKRCTAGGGIFAIYITQIALISVAGWVVGTALAHVAAPFLETYASETLMRFLKAVASEQGVATRTVLGVRPDAIFQAFLWVVPAALVGGIYPVLKASRSDPLSNLSKVG